jgi:hypothetical protein
MAAISMYSNSAAVNRLFSGLSKSSTGLESVISDYGTLKSGSYYKLSKAYYSDLKSGSVSSDSSTKKSEYTYYDHNKAKKATGEYTYYDYATGKYVKSKDGTTKAAADSSKSDASTDTTTKTDNKEVISAANDMMDSAAKLVSTGSASVFRKSNITDEAGNVTYGYDKDKIYDSVSKFVDNYNKLIDSASKSENSSVSNYVSSLKSSTKSEETLLSELGIKADKDTGKLSIDQEAFKKADMTTAKSLFNGTGSFAYQVSTKASMINYYAANDSTSKGTTYSSSGAIQAQSYSAGDLLSAMV